MLKNNRISIFKFNFFAFLLLSFLHATVLAKEPLIVLLDGTRLQCKSLATSESRTWFLCTQGERKIFMTLTSGGIPENLAVEFDKSSSQIRVRSFENEATTGEFHEALLNLEQKSVIGDYRTLVRLEERMSSSEFKSMQESTDVKEILARIRANIKSLSETYATNYTTLEVDLGINAKLYCTRYGAPPCRLYECRDPSAKESKERKILFFDPSVYNNRPFLISWSTGGKLGPLTWSPRTFSPQNTVPLIAPSDDSVYPLKDIDRLDVPEVLSEVATSLPDYLDKFWLRQFKSYTQECKNLLLEEGLESFYRGIETAKDILANTVVRQVLSLSADGWTSYFSSTADPREVSCQRSRDYGEAVSHPFPTLPDAVHRILSEGGVEDLFRSVSSMNDISFQCMEDGCYSRAHVIADRLEKRGVHVEKIWLKGDLRPTSSVEWYYHVAPVVLVLKKDATLERRVIDPSLATKSLSIDEWIALASGPNAKGKVEDVVFPPPKDTAYFQRRSVAFTHSKVFYIDQINPLTPEIEKQNMEKALLDIKRASSQKN